MSEQPPSDERHKYGDHLTLGDHSVRRFTDASGASIVEHAGGRFRHCPWTHRWLPHDD